MFAGSFRGKVLFENPEFINPNAVRSYEKRKAAGVYERRKAREAERKDHKDALKVGPDGLSNKAVFAPDEGEQDESAEEEEDGAFEAGGSESGDDEDMAEEGDDGESEESDDELER